MFVTYILKSELFSKTYVGHTDNFDRRFDQHKNGKSFSTKNKLPLRIIHVELCRDRNEARKLELFFKSGYGREIIHELAGVAERYTR